MTVVGAVLLAGSVLGGCGGGGDDSGGASSGSAGSAEVQDGAARAQGDAPAAPSDEKGSSGGQQAAPLVTERRIVRTAAMTVEAADVEAAGVKVRSIVTAAKGFVQDEQTTAGGAGSDASSVLTLRVPTAGLDGVMSRVAGVGRLVDRSQSSEDVTAKVVDTESRLASQRASVQRVRALLAKATTVGQVVQVEGELSKRQADLESLEAQLKVLSDSAALSTFTVSLQPKGVAAVQPKQHNGFVDGLLGGWHALGASAKVLVTVVGALLPFAILFALVLVPLVVVLRRRAARRPAPVPTQGLPAAPPV
ncbi:hypothetical protein GCM10028814_07050 [Angustibacter aerolatus]